MNNVKLACGEAKTMCTRLNPEEYLWGGGSPAVTVTGLTVKKNDEAFQLKQNLEIQLKPVDDTLSGHYLASYYQKSMDKVLSESYDERLWIARIRLIRQNSSVIIDRIDPPPFGQYVYNAQQLMQLAQLEAYYPEIALRAAAVSGDAAAASRHVAVEQTSAVHNTACGVFDFPLGLGYDMRQPMYSDEIMHGLGKGPVYVEVGLEYITADDTREGDSEIILGDADIFSGSNTTQEERVYQVSTAVKVLPERGTFIVGMKLNEPTGLLSLRVRWYAFRLDEVNKQIGARREGEKMILINPDTIVLQPKSTAHISPVFINMPTEACNFRVVDPEGGSVDNNGLYTAPSKEGVYEIRVEAVSDPTVYTHVFAIVTQKKKD